MGGRYIPPHLRNRQLTQSTTSPSVSSIASTTTTTTTTSTLTHPSTPRAPYTPPHSRSPAHNTPIHTSSSSPTPPGSSFRRQGHGHQRSSASLYVFGDSFVGPFKLLRDDCSRVQTFKGASAKGLNNPNSLKQVSAELVPLLNSLLAPPPYAYLPPTGRYSLLVFGNVDLQINYLWQLQHKPITSATFSESGAEDTAQSGNADSGTASAADILASATENSGKGPALGPQRFVDSVLRAYTEWMDREIVHGPIGRRAEAVKRQGDGAGAGSLRTGGPSAAGAGKKLAPTKVLVAAALPPLVEDATLPRIPEKYVERLEEDHAQAHRALERRAGGDRSGNASGGSGSRTPWSSRPDVHGAGEDVEGLSAVVRNLALSTPQATDTAKVSVKSLLANDPPLCTKPVRIAMTRAFNAGLKVFCDAHPDVLEFVDIWEAMLDVDAGGDGGVEPGPLSSLLLGGREVSNGDASPPRHAHEVDLAPESPPSAHSPSAPTTPTGVTSPDEVSRATWACPVDPSNIHPLWEPTLPLWLAKLGAAGVPTSGFAITDDAERTFRAYEVDKARRMEGKEFSDDGPAVKLRDE